jgi:hypothetical protein
MPGEVAKASSPFFLQGAEMAKSQVKQELQELAEPDVVEQPAAVEQPAVVEEQAAASAPAFVEYRTTRPTPHTFNILCRGVNIVGTWGRHKAYVVFEVPADLEEWFVRHSHVVDGFVAKFKE